MTGYRPMFAPLRAWRRERRARKQSEVDGVIGNLIKKAKAEPGIPQEHDFGGARGKIVVTFGEKKPPMEYVVARTYAQASDFARLNGFGSRWRYINDPDMLRGTHKPRVTWLAWPFHWTQREQAEYIDNLDLAWRR